MNKFHNDAETKGNTEFERNYRKKVNTAGFIFLAAHLPVLCALALAGHKSMLLVAAIGIVLLAGPGALLASDRSSNDASLVLAVSAMGISALAIHVCNGLIEVHFEIFLMIALLTIYGRVAPLIVAGATIALHHVFFWVWLPASVFNYQASFAIVLLHAFFVVMEVVPACWIAVQFGKAIRTQGIVKEQLGSAVELVSESARRLCTTGGSLASSASQQAATIEETSASAVEMNSLSTRTAEESEGALKLMIEMDKQLAEANADLKTMQSVVKDIVVSSNKIGKVVKLIDGIAFQTNILALNAAVEAATAGAAGAGFSVVATEVGSLAQRSATAASDSASLIEFALQTTRTGEKTAGDLGKAMGRLTDTADLVKAKIFLMQGDSLTQRQAGAQIKQAIQQLGNSAQQTASGAEDSATAGATLEQQAEKLRGIVTLLQA